MTGGGGRGEPHVLVLGPYRPGRAPSQRYRIEQWQPLLEREGLRFEMVPFASERLQELLYRPGRHLAKAVETLRCWLARLLRSARPGDFDLALVHRELALLGPAWCERLLARSGLPFVYDFDDAIFLPATSETNPLAGWLRPPGKTAVACRLARAVLAGNSWLAAWARDHCPDVTVVPSTIDAGRYRPRTDWRAGARLTLGWTGSHSSLRYLELLRPVMAEAARRLPLRLVVVGARLEVPGLEIEHRPWRAESEPEDLADIDVGLMPLADEPWALGKCSFKALQFMGLAIPVVVSPIGMNREVVEDGANGLWAAGDAGWLDAIARLHADPDLRRRLGLAGRRTVEERYSAAVQAPRVAAVLRRAAGPRESHPGQGR